jgi:hypothetical protein
MTEIFAVLQTDADGQTVVLKDAYWSIEEAREGVRRQADLYCERRHSSDYEPRVLNQEMVVVYDNGSRYSNYDVCTFRIKRLRLSSPLQALAGQAG